jgi:hypothetical protein
MRRVGGGIADLVLTGAQVKDFAQHEDSLAFGLSEQEIFGLHFWIHSEARESEHDRADALGRDEVVVS